MLRYKQSKHKPVLDYGRRIRTSVEIRTTKLYNSRMKVVSETRKQTKIT